MDFSSVAAASKIERILAALTATPRLDREQLAKATHMSSRQAYDYIRYLTAKGSRKIRISGWRVKERGQGRPRPLYSVGNWPDAPMPAPVGVVESKLRWWQSLRSDYDRYDAYLSRRRLQKRPPTLDPVLVALHGRTTHQPEVANGR